RDSVPRPFHSFPTRRSSDLLRSLDVQSVVDQLRARKAGGPELQRAAEAEAELRARKEGRFKPGEKIRHAEFGVGIVTKSTGSGEDRKSTRLNSSHRTISYAV